jgi:hypothetical protein
LSAPLIYVGISRRDAASMIRLSPNPTSGIITLTGDGIAAGTFITRIYNPVGTLLSETTNEKTLDLFSYPNGCYYLVLKTGNREIIRKKIVLVK